MQAFEAVTPDVLIEGNLYSSHSIQLTGKTFEIYNTGAHHSFGDLVIYQKEAKIVWIADLAFNNRVTFMADGNAKSAIDAQNWLLKTFADAKLMIPGHGSAQTPPFTMVTRTRDYMQRLRTDMTKAVQQEVDLIDATQNTVYEDWKTVRMYELNHRKNVEFVYREVEEEAF